MVRKKLLDRAANRSKKRIARKPQNKLAHRMGIWDTSGNGSAQPFNARPEERHVMSSIHELRQRQRAAV